MIPVVGRNHVGLPLDVKTRETRELRTRGFLFTCFPSSGAADSVPHRYPQEGNDPCYRYKPAMSNPFGFSEEISLCAWR